MTTPDHSSNPAGLALILGLGETGTAAARWLARQGMRVRVADTRAQPPGLDLLRTLGTAGGEDIDYALGLAKFDVSLLDGVSQVVLSPGLVPTEPALQAVLDSARANGIEVVGEIELFARALKNLAAERGYTPHLLAVTGTNGKTTVTALARQMIEASGLRARAAGNIGPAALTALMADLDQDSLPDVWVIELSSFQLETTQSLDCNAAAILNVTQDHLDWHGSMALYAQAKARLFGQSRLAVVNRDDPLVAAMVPALDAPTVRGFGRDAPEWVGDLGLERANGVLWLTACEPNQFDEPPAPAPRRKKNAAATPPPARAGGRLSRLMPVDALGLRGLHNAANVLSALALGRALGLGWGPMLRVAREYGGEPHRVQFVRSVSGVDFIDDSKGTNVGATVAALEGLERDLILIAGGVGKGQDFTPLAAGVARHARAVVLIGQDAAEIEQALAGAGKPMHHAASLDDAVHQALRLAQPGDAVLLSPACASFDMFKNYVNRGQSFAQAVRELALEQGEVA